MEYFDGYSEAEDLSKDQELRPTVFDELKLPIEKLTSRQFETLAWYIKQSEFGFNARVRLMQGSSEQGRDVVVYSQKGKVEQIIQCKLWKTKMYSTNVRQELLKLFFHSYLKQDIIGSGPVRYELWCPGGLHTDALNILYQWPNSWVEDEVFQKDVNSVLQHVAIE